MTANRLRWGALAWLLTLQFFVVETIVQLQLPGYSRSRDVISLLGSSLSPADRLMNASFVLQGALILAGVLALRPLLRGTAGKAAVGLLGAAAVGVLLVGVFPLDGNLALHRTGAILHFAGGAVGLIALAYAVRRRSEAVGTALALLGLVGAAGTVFFLTGVTAYLGDGGTERAAGYVVPLGLALAGVALWRLGTDPSAVEAERAQTRAAKAERDRERDAALEAAARRSEERTADEHDAPQAPEDPEDHWESTSGRGRV